MQAFEGCALKQGARNLVFADGNPAARLMVIGEAPGRDEDLAGLPFVGRSGQLLDRMLAAIGLSRRVGGPGRRGLHHQHAALAAAAEPRARRPTRSRRCCRSCTGTSSSRRPEVLLLVGSAAVRTLMQTGEGITRMRGRWLDWRGVPVIATFHPAALLRDGLKKREVWADLLSLKARLDAGH